MYSDCLILEAKKIMLIDRQQYLETNKASLTLTEASVRKKLQTTMLATSGFLLLSHPQTVRKTRIN